MESKKILQILAKTVLQALQPEKLLAKAVQLRGGVLVINKQRYNLRQFKNIYVVGAGKATYGMAKQINHLLGKRITAGYINVPLAHTKTIGNIIVNKASHPLPNAAGERGARLVMQLVKQATKDDLVICLISGGCSSLLPLPIAKVSLNDKIILTQQLMLAGANITELNVVRKHLSAIKGGQLALAAKPATVISLIISDVIGDQLDVIASSPTAVDMSTSDEAIAVLKHYNLCTVHWQRLLHQHETPKQLLNNVHNIIIGSNQQALVAAANVAKQLKLHPYILTSTLQGETRQVTQVLMAIVQEIKKYNRPVRRPALLLSGGETTVTVTGEGSGGRNQELVLAALPHLTKNVAIMSLATDGVDGFTPKPVAGALADYKTLLRSKAKKINLQYYLTNNDSYAVLKKLGCHIITGPTGTNVGDVIMILVK
ncbi:MAG: glycerate kinase [Patescibacteria group bacterium]